MRFGVCTGIENAGLVTAAGWDYLELGVSTALVPEAESAAWDQSKKRLLALPLPCETFNLFVPGALKITGPAVETAALSRYVHTALARAAEVGGKLIVFGSGGARQLSEDWSTTQAHAQLLWFLHQNR